MQFFSTSRFPPIHNKNNQVHIQKQSMYKYTTLIYKSIVKNNLNTYTEAATVYIDYNNI